MKKLLLYHVLVIVLVSIVSMWGVNLAAQYSVEKSQAVESADNSLEREIQQAEVIYSNLAKDIMNIETELSALTEEIELLVEQTAPQIYRIDFTAEEFKHFTMLVEHEAGGASYECRVWVASVVVNRVLDERYPNTLMGVIYDTKHAVQFSPTIDGLFKQPSRLTAQASMVALADDYAFGCYIFNNKSLTAPSIQEYFEKFEMVMEIDEVQFRR